MKKGFFDQLGSFWGGKKPKTASQTAPDTLLPPYDRYVLLARLLPMLPPAGMPLSPDRLIRLELLLSALPADTPATALGPCLAPLFATDPQQQVHFSQLMAAAISDLDPDFGKEMLKKEDLPDPKKRDKVSNPNPTPSPRHQDTQTRQDTTLSVDLEQCTEPPYIWNISLDKPIPIADGGDSSRTFTRLRSRESSDLQFLDWPATLRATIAQAGMPVLRYRSRTRPVEYLMLIERFAAEDHRALLFDRIYRNLRDKEVLVERFFHDGDPRSCYNEQNPNGISLRELRYRHSNSRLLMIGSGYRMLSTGTGQAADWAETAFSAWKSRLLLTPVARGRWGIREFNLKSLFFLLPAAWESLQYAAENPQPDPSIRYADLPDALRAAAEWPQHTLESPFLPVLKERLPTVLLPWVAACAVWPALHFDLTLRLGRLLSDEQHNLLRFDYLTRLTALPWFANGFIPVEARRELLEYAEQEHPGLLSRCSASLLELLQQNPPDKPRSYAAAEHSLYIALLNVMANPVPSAEQMERLHTVLKRLRRRADITDFVLPPSVANMLDLQDMDDPDPLPPTEAPPYAKATAGKMKLVKGGTFTMGCTGEQGSECYDDEKPAHPVKVADFEIGVTAITVAQYKAFIEQSQYKTDADKLGSSRGWTGSAFKDMDGVNWRCDTSGKIRPENEYEHPVIHVSWNDAQAYCAWLSVQTGRKFRLPSEAEWEFAARGGTLSKGYKYAGSNDLKEVGWFSENAEGNTHPVGEKKANELGLFDMSGNVWEWCEDDWHSNYEGAPGDSKAWLEQSGRGTCRVFRGGSWFSDAQFCRVSVRNYGTPGYRDNNLGFRLASSPQ